MLASGSVGAGPEVGSSGSVRGGVMGAGICASVGSIGSGLVEEGRLFAISSNKSALAASTVSLECTVSILGPTMSLVLTVLTL